VPRTATRPPRRVPEAAPKDAKYGTGCESCHGPGKAHVQAIEAAAGDDAKIAAANMTLGAQCAGCHTAHREQLPDKSFEIK